MSIDYNECARVMAENAKKEDEAKRRYRKLYKKCEVCDGTGIIDLTLPEGHFYGPSPTRACDCDHGYVPVFEEVTEGQQCTPPTNESHTVASKEKP